MILGLIITAALKVGVSPGILAALCIAETNLRPINNFRDHHKNENGSFGICQVSVGTARMFFPFADRLALQRADFNAIVAATVYKKKLDENGGDQWKAVAGYNSGTVYYRPDGTFKNSKYVNKVRTIYYRDTINLSASSSKLSDFGQVSVMRD